ncbi:hypothetical protein FHL15_009075 [Xylaria flabelliformis]|uniref:Nephrocystin 3-like N-terminal domain-containing protein n=1 Tax=Xylaria flabelliformis TaxID=2512241 RepID=A0A553HPU3_9PEZI|nr:hypothetical protein FHL15_009075 [Xylaria flabelliformis]
MDLVSVAAVTTGLVTLADAVFRRIYKYYKSVSDASNEIKELAEQILSLAEILHSLGILVDALELDGTQSIVQMTHVADATRLLEEIQARLNKPKPNHQVIGLALQADSSSNLVNLLNNGEDIKARLSSIHLGVENLQILTRVKVDGKRQRIRDYFLKANPQPNLDTSIKLRHPNTGVWLITSLQFQKWIKKAGSRMWLGGIPGAGKTAILKALEKGKNSPEVDFRMFQRNIFIVDDLDECGDDTAEATQAWANIADNSTNVTIALASRDEYNIDIKLRDSFTKIKVAAQKKDLSLYVAFEIDRRIKDGRLRINDMDQKDDILAKLSNDADGT